MQRIVFTAPVALTFKGLEIDSINGFNLETGEVSGSYSLIRSDGKRYRSIPFSFSVQAAADNLVQKLLQKLVAKVDQIDGNPANLAGTIVDVPEGTPIP